MYYLNKLLNIQSLICNIFAIKKQYSLQIKLIQSYIYVYNKYIIVRITTKDIVALECQNNRRAFQSLLQPVM